MNKFADAAKNNPSDENIALATAYDLINKKLKSDKRKKLFDTHCDYIFNVKDLVTKRYLINILNKYLEGHFCFSEVIMWGRTTRAFYPLD
jgi:hypothetical protein